ncbi:MAG TPA: LLM class flavin-dependent oxidoreductase [Acidimicrobiales bacterium]|nr:LLM class flavin-dependent oxidoreductase [Acidimicrobiales bacterium]
MTIGVLLHINNPSLDDVEAVAGAAEDAGADFVGVPDAFWWRDTWILAARAAAATARIAVGPMVTNPYLRHPFQTLASLATLQDVAGDRVILGVGAGGSEITAAAHIGRTDAATRIRALARLARAVAAGAPLDGSSRRRLEIPLRPTPIVVAGRGDAVLRAAGAVGDYALLWAIPHPDLGRSAALVTDAATGRDVGPELIWAPVVDHDGEAAARTSIAYSVLNSHAGLHEQWGLRPADLERLRTVLVSEGNAAASALVPDEIVPDLVLSAGDIDRAARLAAEIGASSVAVRADNAATVGERVEWARRILTARAVGAGADR